MNFKKYQRIVVKIGSSLLISENQLNYSWLKTIAEDISVLKSEGKEVIIVTSGAVAIGRKAISRATGYLRLEEKQAASATGQTELMQGYANALAPYSVAQILLTFWDTERRRNYLNAKNAIETMLENNIIPIINENDVIATTELAYGDNDRLSARVAQMLGADLLILLSDVDGLYNKNPQTHDDAEHIERVELIDSDIEDMGGGAESAVGTGGMVTKIEAAKIATNSGCDCILTSGLEDNAISKLSSLKPSGGKAFTIFESKTNALSARKQWIVSGVQAMGELMVDAGAAKALKAGSSLLPAGVVSVEGEFERGDLIVVMHAEEEIGRGLSAYSSGNAEKIIGRQSDDIESILGYSGRSELIHRDDLVVL